MQTNKRVLEGERLYLRPFTLQDVEAYHSTLFHEESRRLTGTKTIFSQDMIEKFVERISSDSTRIDLLLIRKQDEKSVGDIVLMDMDETNRSAHMRITIFDEEDYGKGYGPEAIRLLLHHAFGVLNLHRIELNVYAFNQRAIRAYEKIGFVQEGRMRDVLYYNYEYHDSITMSMLAHEFKNKYMVKQ
ncbi:GNAT family N-acetyltransferase [Paenibacillus sp. KN14-4R]|uniref:GNAT family N-acetyltransferase n=1 Tax=Paenibacillus sp. KN14-4R TaxID=3445773 RepID=UPI003FA02F53